MVLSGTIYDKIKESLDKYLFGFDKSQLNVSLYNGAINLKSVNIKPNKAEKLLLQLNLPFSLKAGTIGHLELKLSLVSSLFGSSGPQNIVVNLDEVYFIVGPSLRMRSKDDSYLAETEEELLQPYDQNNCFNIFSNNLKLKKKKDLRPLASTEEAKKREKTSEDHTLTKEHKDMLKNVTLNIKKLHVRYEDDYFCEESCPYSCGIVVEEITLESSEIKQVLEKLSEMRPREVNQADYEKGKGISNSLIKNLKAKGVKLYWNCLSEMYIPTSLWEQTRTLKYQIFEAMDAASLNELMAEAFLAEDQDPNQRVVTTSEVSLQLHNYDASENGLTDRTRQTNIVSISSAKITVNASPYVLSDMKHLVERFQTHYLLRDLKQYRPHRKPITDVPKHLEKRLPLRKKRKLIVRDWFFFVVWFVRLRRIVKGMVQKDIMNKYLFFDPKYADLLSKVFNKQLSLDKVLEQVAADEAKNKNVSPPMRHVLNIRCQDAVLNVYQKQLFDCKKQMPDIELLASRIAINFSQKAVESDTSEKEKKAEQMGISAQLVSFDLATYTLLDQEAIEKYQKSKPKELSQMMIKQDVVVQRVNMPTQQNKSRQELFGLGQNQRNAVVQPYSKKSDLQRFTSNQNLQKQRILGGLSRSKNNSICETQGALPGGNQILQYSLPKTTDYSSKGNQLNTSDYISPIDARKQAILNQDNDHNLKHNLPNMTSPGKLIGIDNLQGNQMPLDTLTSNAPSIAPQQEGRLKKSSSKDSLFDTVLGGVKNLLSRQTLDHDDIYFEKGDEPVQVYEEVKRATPIQKRGPGQAVVNLDHNASKANKINVKTPVFGSMNVSTLSQKNFIQQEFTNQRPRGGTEKESIYPMSTLQKQRSQHQPNMSHAVIDQELEALITPIGLTHKRSYVDRYKQKKSPITQLFNNGDMGDIDGSIIQTGKLSDSDNTTRNDEEEGAHHSRNQGKRKNMYDGIKNKNFKLLVPKNNVNQGLRSVRNQTSHQPNKQLSNNLAQVQSQRDFHHSRPAHNQGSNTLGNLLRNRSNVVSKNNATNSSFIETQTNHKHLNSYATGPLPPADLSQPHTMQSSHQPDSKANQLPCKMVPETKYVRERLLTLEKATDRVAKASEQYVVQFKYELDHECMLAKRIEGDVRFGSIQLTYSNNALNKVFDLYSKFKELPSFRDLNFLVQQASESVLCQNSQDFQDEIIQRQLYRNIYRNIRDGIRLSGQQGQMASEAHRKKHESKVEFFSMLVKDSKIDLKVTADKAYVSFFDEKTRDHCSKFVSPPISLSVYQNGQISEAGFEIFGFQYQQTTDLNLLTSFTGSLMQHTEIFLKNENLSKGKVFYDQMIQKQRDKLDFQRRITQQALLKRQQSQSRSPPAHQMNHQRLGRAATSIEKVGPPLKTLKTVTLGSGRNGTASKPGLLPQQAIQPNSNAKSLERQAKAETNDKNPQSMVGSQLQLQQVGSKQRIGYNSDDEDLAVSDGSIDKMSHYESAVSYRKTNSSKQKKRKQVVSDEADDRISSQEESQHEALVQQTKESLPPMHLQQQDNRTINTQNQQTYDTQLEGRPSQQFAAASKVNHAFVKIQQFKNNSQRNAAYHTDSQGGEAAYEKEESNALQTTEPENYNSIKTPEQFLDNTGTSTQMAQAIKAYHQNIQQQHDRRVGDQDEPLMLGDTVTDPATLQLSLLQKNEAQQQSFHMKSSSGLGFEQANPALSLNDPPQLKQWRSTRETQNYSKVSASKKKVKNLQQFRERLESPLFDKRESAHLPLAGKANPPPSHFYQQNHSSSFQVESNISRDSASPLKQQTQKQLKLQMQQSDPMRQSQQSSGNQSSAEIKSLLFMAGKKFKVEKDM